MNDPGIAALGRRQALTAIVPVVSGQAAGLEAKLLLRRNQWASGLRNCSSLHFAKLALIPALEPGAEVSGLLIETTFDAELGAHLGELWDHASGVYADLLQACVGGDKLDRDGFRALIDRHAVRAAAACSAHAALSRGVVDNDAALDRLSQAFLDRAQREVHQRLVSPLELAKGLREHLEASEQVWLGSLELEAGTRADGPSRRLRRSFARFGFARRAARKPQREAKDRPRSEQGVQSSSLMLAPGPRGRFQRWAFATLLAELEREQEPDPLAESAELARIHAARWVRLADGRILISITHDGASEAFRARLTTTELRELWSPPEAIELYPQIWYSAYPELSVNDVLRNHRIRELMARPLDGGSARALCAML